MCYKHLISFLFVSITYYGIVMAVQTVELNGPRLVQVFTPFKENGDINLAVIPSYAKYLYNNNLTDLWLFSVTGEVFSVNMNERKQIVLAWLKVNSEYDYGFVFFVGTGFMTVTDACAFSAFCESVGVTAIVYKTITDAGPITPEQAVSDISYIAQCAASTPIFFYYEEEFFICDRNPSVTLVVKGAVAEIPNFGGLISTLENGLLSMAFNPSCDVQYIAFYFTTVAAANLLEFDAHSTPFVNIFPQDIVAIDNAKSITSKLAVQTEFNKKAAPLCELRPDCRLFCALNILKAALKLLTGVNTGSPRKPLCNITQGDIIATKSILTSLGYKKFYLYG